MKVIIYGVPSRKPSTIQPGRFDPAVADLPLLLGLGVMEADIGSAAYRTTRDFRPADIEPSDLVVVVDDPCADEIAQAYHAKNRALALVHEDSKSGEIHIMVITPNHRDETTFTREQIVSGLPFRQIADILKKRKDAFVPAEVTQEENAALRGELSAANAKISEMGAALGKQQDALQAAEAAVAQAETDKGALRDQIKALEDEIAALKTQAKGAGKK